MIKSYQLQNNEKWIPAADIMECNNFNCEITEDFSRRDKELDTKEEADKFIREFLTAKGFRDLKNN